MKLKNKCNKTYHLVHAFRTETRSDGIGDGCGTEHMVILQQHAALLTLISRVPQFSLSPLTQTMIGSIRKPPLLPFIHIRHSGPSIKLPRGARLHMRSCNSLIPVLSVTTWKLTSLPLHNPDTGDTFGTRQLKTVRILWPSVTFWATWYRGGISPHIEYRDVASPSHRPAPSETWRSEGRRSRCSSTTIQGAVRN